MARHKFRSGFNSCGIDADDAANELERIHSERGSLTAEAVVDESRPDDAPLHPAFDWNDHTAAEKWRVHTARNLIRSVVVVTDDHRQEPTFVNVSVAPGERSYEPVHAIVNQPDLFQMAVHDAQRRINSAKQALDELTAAAAGGSDINKQRLAAIQIAAQALTVAAGAVGSLH